ncbi:phage tail tape measure protein [Agreia pratensis]|uniref:Phage tail tape measure protein, TP901 family, core region n=1 Tax=Agreia pratensis TaxID=150121 RepID=A0A1X7K3X9_9MICO|nr:phage tail tape measure protein, TP901 family, core region [Agreia pratensis]
MGTRNTRVSLTAEVAGYISGMDKAAAKTRELGTEAEKLAQKKQAFETLGVGALAFGATAAAAVSIAVAKFAQFDEAMSNVKAATQESAANMALLRGAAVDAGASTVYSAVEAAGAIEELGKAGLSTSEILNGGLDGALSLAAAGQLEVADAAQVTAIALKQFQLGGDQASHVADLLAAGAGKAVGDVSDLAAALGQAGLVANGAGQSIEDTTGVLAAFADAGLLGSDAGTSLKSSIIALQAPTAKSKSLMDEYNLSFYDGNGQMLSYSEIAGQLKTRLGGLDDETRNAALAQIFGNDALRAANVLYEQGAAGIQKYVDQTNDSGYAAQVAADRLDNLKGDIEKLGGAFDTLLVKSGSGLNDTLRGATQSLTFLTDAAGGLPAPVLSTATALTGIAGSLALAGGAALVAIPRFADFKDSLDTLDLSGRKVSIGIGLAGGAVAAATLALGLFVAEQAKAAAKVDAFAGSLDDQTGSITEYTRKMIAANLATKDTFAGLEADDSAFDNAEKLGISLDTVTEAALGSAPALRELNKELDIGTVGSDKFKQKQKETGLSVLELSLAAKDLAMSVQGESSSLAEAAKQAEQKNSVTEAGIGVSGSAADAYSDEAQTVEELQSNLSALIDTINASNETGQDAISANLDYQNSLAKVDEYVQKAREGADGYSLTLDQATQAGRDNLEMLNGLAGSSQGAAEAQFALDGNTATFQATLAAGRQTIIDRATALGYTADQASALADQVYRIPTEREINILAETNTAAARLRELHELVDAIPTSKSITVSASGNGLQYSDSRENHAYGGTVGLGAVAQAAMALAGGGTAVGPGTSKSDSIPVWLSAGEEVIQEPYASQYRGLLKSINSGSYMSQLAREAQWGVGSLVSAQSGMGALVPAGGSINVAPTVSLAGTTLIATMDGVPFQMVIQDQIASANRDRSTTLSTGRAR